MMVRVLIMKVGYAAVGPDFDFILTEQLFHDQMVEGPENCSD